MTLSPHLRKKKNKKGSKRKHLVVLTIITFHPMRGSKLVYSYSCLRNDTITQHEGQAQKQDFRDWLNQFCARVSDEGKNQRRKTKPEGLVWMRKVRDKNSQNLP
jgi:hypothetical protein